MAADSPRTLVVTMPYFEELKLRVADKSVEDLADPIGDEAFDGNPVWCLESYLCGRKIDTGGLLI